MINLKQKRGERLVIKDDLRMVFKNIWVSRVPDWPANRQFSLATESARSAQGNY
jgi:hypothetical protein